MEAESSTARIDCMEYSVFRKDIDRKSAGLNSASSEQFDGTRVHLALGHRAGALVHRIQAYRQLAFFRFHGFVGQLPGAALKNLAGVHQDRKSTRLNSSHSQISY